MMKGEETHVPAVVLVGDQDEQIDLPLTQDLLDLLRGRCALEDRHLIGRCHADHSANQLAGWTGDQHSIADGKRHLRAGISGTAAILNDAPPLVCRRVVMEMGCQAGRTVVGFLQAHGNAAAVARVESPGADEREERADDLILPCGGGAVQLALIAGFDRTYVSLVERGLSSPTIRTLVRLAEVLDVRPSKIVKQMEELLPKWRRAAR